MRARACWVAAGLALSTVAGAEPKPAAVDIKPLRDQMIVLQDAQGGVYAVQTGRGGRAFYGTPKQLYEQVVVTYSADGETGAWDVGVWAPRLRKFQPGSIQRKSDGSFVRWCGDDDQVGLSQVAGDKAKQVLDKATFMSTALVRHAHLLARDDSGVYYYVDMIRAQYGGKGYRVFVGKKGAMKEMPLTDIASDTAGEVFATKTGDLRIVNEVDENAKSKVTWVHGEKRTPLVVLDSDANQALIYKELGVYAFTGTICDTI